MSSDVQGTSEIPHKALEELKEVTDESDSVPFRLSLDTKMIRLVDEKSLVVVLCQVICKFPWARGTICKF